MPKTTKTTRKASPASNKKSGLKRRFDLTNKKVQFFVVIGIVAILGGGYFTFKSFAATGVRASFTPGNGIILNNSGACKKSVTADEAAKGATVGVLSCPGSGGSGSATAQASSSGSILGGGKRRACFNVKGGGSVIGQIYVSASLYGPYSKYLPSSELQKINSNGYTNVCTPWIDLSSNPEVRATISLNNTKAGILTVSGISFEYDTNVTHPAPSTSPSK